jgi:hypothetical protein
VLSYELRHKDGRTSFPLVLVNWVPFSSETTLMTLHASAFLDFQNVVRTAFRSQSRSITTKVSFQADISKVIDIQDGAESLTKDVIDAKLLSS